MTLIGKKCAVLVALVLSVLFNASVLAETIVHFGHYNIRELDNYELDVTTSTQAKAAAEIIQMHAPDVLSINEMSYDIEGIHGSTHTGINVQLFEDNYLSISQNGQPPITYEYKYFVQGNSGLDSGLGFDYGYGTFEGQYTMAFYSKFPILTDDVRRFQTFLWIDLPDNIKPVTVPDEQRLMDKDFWDIPIDVNGRVVHVLMCHAVTPVFEAYNDERNYDSLRFIKDYIEGNATYATPDGGMGEDDLFVVVGDLNADPEDGDSMPGAVQQILDSARVIPSQPVGDGLDPNGVNTTYYTGGTNYTRNTFKSGIGNTSPGGFQLQLDYMVPSVTMPVDEPEPGEVSSHVYWDQLGTTDWPLQRTASDHHFMWTDFVVANADGDCDGDGDVDLGDFLNFQTCFTGPGGGPVGEECQCADFDGDDDVDLQDFVAFQSAYTGPQ